MKSIKNNRPVIVGIFVFLGLAILIIAVFTLGNQKKTFVKAFAINAVFNDVGGLQEGGNVWFSGVKIGVVKKISFYGNFQVLVTMNLEKNAASHIHKDAKAKIGSDGLIGNKIVIIYGGGVASAPVTKGDFLKVEKALSTEDMLVTLQANNKNLLVITNSFKSIANKIDSGGGTIGTLLNDASLSNKLKVTLNNLQATTANFEAASLNSKKVISDIQAFTSKLNTPGSLTNEVVTDTTIFNNLKATVIKLRESANTASQFLYNLKTTGESFNRKDNAAGVILNDPDVAVSLKTTIKNLEASSEKLNEDLEALQHNFLLKGYFRKKAKNNPQ
jgi:phospholipid/cholesterol/gamma-HCH transport system substrate-binding protein